MTNFKEITKNIAPLNLTTLSLGQLTAYFQLLVILAFSIIIVFFDHLSF